MALKFYTSAAKGLKLIVRKFLGLIPTSIVEKGEKLIKGAFLAPSILNRISCVYCDFFEVLSVEKCMISKTIFLNTVSYNYIVTLLFHYFFQKKQTSFKNFFSFLKEKYIFHYF